MGHSNRAMEMPRCREKWSWEEELARRSRRARRARRMERPYWLSVVALGGNWEHRRDGYDTFARTQRHASRPGGRKPSGFALRGGRPGNEEIRRDALPTFVSEGDNYFDKRGASSLRLSGPFLASRPVWLATPHAATQEFFPKEGSVLTN
jgi:hypothetical protein